MFSAIKLKSVSAYSIAFSLFMTVILSFLGTSPASAFVGTLENGNMAYAQSSFATGEACNYLPGFTSANYDAWHFVLTTRGAVFQQSPTDPTVAINLNFVFMRQDGSLFVLKSGAWVQSGKGAYVFTLTNDRIRMVQTGSVANINVVDSGMRLSHTCPGTGTGATPVASPTPTPTATISSPSPTPTATTASPTPSRSSSPTPTVSSTPTPTASPTPTTSASPSPTTSATRSSSPTPSASASPSASPSPSISVTSTPTPTASSSPRPSARASAIQPHSTRSPNPSGSPFPRNPLPTPTTSIQPINTPTPTASPSRSNSPTPSPSTSRTSSPSPTPTASVEPSQSPEPSATPTLEPPVLPTPPTVEDPKEVIYVDPKTPTVIPPSELPKAPDTPIEVVTPPKYGDVTITPTGEVTYTSNIVDVKSTVVDVVEFKYTNLAGQTIVVRKEFVLTQKGDVPRIIQTGEGGPNKSHKNVFAFLILGATLALLTRKGLAKK